MCNLDLWAIGWPPCSCEKQLPFLFVCYLYITPFGPLRPSRRQCWHINPSLRIHISYSLHWTKVINIFLKMPLCGRSRDAICQLSWKYKTAMHSCMKQTLGMYNTFRMYHIYFFIWAVSVHVQYKILWCLLSLTNPANMGIVCSALPFAQIQW